MNPQADRTPLSELVEMLEERIRDLEGIVGDIATKISAPSEAGFAQPTEGIPEEPPSDLLQLIDRIGRLEGVIRRREHETFDWLSAIAKHLGIGNISQPVANDVGQTEVARVEDAVYSNKLLLEKMKGLLNRIDNKAEIFMSRIYENRLLLESIKVELGLGLGHVVKDQGDLDKNPNDEMKSESDQVREGESKSDRDYDRVLKPGY